MQFTRRVGNDITDGRRDFAVGAENDASPSQNGEHDARGTGVRSDHLHRLESEDNHAYVFAVVQDRGGWSVWSRGDGGVRYAMG